LTARRPVAAVGLWRYAALVSRLPPSIPGDPFAGGLRARLAIAGVAIALVWAFAAFGLL
jgi:hypothetical protein